MKVRVVIAEDAALFRAGLARLIEDHGHRVCAAVGDGDALLAAVAEYQPDVVVADIRMPPTYTDEGLRAALEIRLAGIFDKLGLPPDEADNRRVLAVLRYLGS
jgi:DNA-binding NarL/FixJ family response regulator